jgi:hypothetical protein
MAPLSKQKGPNPGDDFLTTIAVSAEQVMLAANPDLPCAQTAGAAQLLSVGRRYPIRMDDPDLARRVNDFLCRER